MHGLVHDSGGDQNFINSCKVCSFKQDYVMINVCFSGSVVEFQDHSLDLMGFKKTERLTDFMIRGCLGKSKWRLVTARHDHKHTYDLVMAQFSFLVSNIFLRTFLMDLMYLWELRS